MMEQGYKPTYLRMLQNQVTAVFNHAERFYGLKENPCKKIDKMGKANTKELNFWTKEEFDRFIQSFDEKEEMYHLMYQMFFWLGCWVGELLAIVMEILTLKKKQCLLQRLIIGGIKRIILQHPRQKVQSAL